MMRFHVAIISCVATCGCALPADATTINQNPLLQCPPQQQIRPQMLEQINRARSAPRLCGAQRYPAAAPVAWNAKLADAARHHSLDMARRDYLGHSGVAGRGVGHRVREAGYVWRAVGENLAAGHDNVRDVIASWLASPGHCANLMGADFREIGAACARHPSSEYGTYWTIVLAAPR